MRNFRGMTKGKEHNDLRHDSSNQRGFTLIELTIALTITGVIMAGLFGAMKQSGEIRNTRMSATFDNLLLGMSEFYRIYGYYPCPANPTLNADDPNYGEPHLDGTGACVASAPSLSAPGVGGGTVITGAVPVRALNRALGCADTDPASLPDNLKQVFQNKLNSARQIFFGNQSDYDNYAAYDETDVSSVKNLSDTSRQCVPDSLMEDVYDNKITYAVNFDATKLDIDLPVGNISVVNRFNQPVTADRLNFIMVSHGKDAKGAYPINSANIPFPCGGGTALDDENCDNDATFRSMPVSPMTDRYAANNYDDRVEFSLVGYSRERDVWRWAEGADPNKRNLVFEGKAGQPLTIGIPQTPPPVDEKVGVYGGNMQVDGNMTAQGSTAAPVSDIIADQTIKATENIVVDNTAGPTPTATAPKFCYDPPLTANCNGP